MLGVEPENRRLSLGVKQLQPDVWDTFFAQHRVGRRPSRARCSAPRSSALSSKSRKVSEGLCHVSEGGQRVSARQSTWKSATEHEFKIVKDEPGREEGRLVASSAVGEEASRAEVESYKEAAAAGGQNKGNKAPKPGQGSSSSSSSSSSTTLGDLLNWKRAEREDNDSN